MAQHTVTINWGSEGVTNLICHKDGTSEVATGYVYDLTDSGFTVKHTIYAAAYMRAMIIEKSLIPSTATSAIFKVKLTYRMTSSLGDVYITKGYENKSDYYDDAYHKFNNSQEAVTVTFSDDASLYYKENEGYYQIGFVFMKSNINTFYCYFSNISIDIIYIIPDSNIRIGNETPKAIYIGSQKVKQIFIGNTLFYSSE